MRKVLALLLSVVMALSLMVTTAWADPVEQDLAGKTVILHTNDVHGEIARYAKVAALKAELRLGAQMSSWSMPATTARAPSMSASTRAPTP